MGLPSHPALSSIYGMQHVSFEGFSRSAAGRLIGNGMSVPCIGAILAWCGAYVTPDIVERQRELVLLGDNPEIAPNATKGASEEVAAGCSSFADVTIWTALGQLGRALCNHSMFAGLYRALRGPQETAVRVRELFPLPLIPRIVVEAHFNLYWPAVDEASSYLDGVIVGLNWMYGFDGSGMSIGRMTAARREAHAVILSSAAFHRDRLADGIGTRTNEGWHSFEKKGEAPRLDLVADSGAIPDCAATCFSSDVIQGCYARAIDDVGVIFPNPPPGLDRFPGFYSGERAQYILLTARQLRAGLLRLATSCRGGASAFPVGKPNGKQRVVWNGTRISQAAARPPMPPHVADPAVFGMIDIPSGVQLRATKRDCRTWFDQLAVHDDIGSFFGRPRVLRAELLNSVEPMIATVSYRVRVFGRWDSLGRRLLHSLH